MGTPATATYKILLGRSRYGTLQPVVLITVASEIDPKLTYAQARHEGIRIERNRRAEAHRLAARILDVTPPEEADRGMEILRKVVAP